MADKFNNETHRCMANNCRTQVAKKRLMCIHHWSMLPKQLQDKLYDAYRKRNNQPEGPANHRAAMVECINFIRGQERPSEQPESLIKDWKPNQALSQVEPSQMVRKFVDTFNGLARPKPRLLLTSGSGYAVDFVFEQAAFDQEPTIEAKAELVAHVAYQLAIKYFSDIAGAVKNEF